MGGKSETSRLSRMGARLETRFGAPLWPRASSMPLRLSDRWIARDEAKAPGSSLRQVRDSTATERLCLFWLLRFPGREHRFSRDLECSRGRFGGCVALLSGSILTEPHFKVSLNYVRHTGRLQHDLHSREPKYEREDPLQSVWSRSRKE